MIHWDDDTTDVLLNPRMGAEDAAEVRRRIAACAPLAGHVWVTTSGSTGRLKPVALAKAAMLAAAAAVNDHVGATADDVWCRPLPAFHVGGLAIHARAHLTGSTVHVIAPWDPFAFHMLLADKGVTLTSLVPTQLRDLLDRGLAAPPSVRAVLLGGGAAPAPLVEAAAAAGWPLLPSYGATETCAAIAFQPAPASARLRVMPFAEARLTADGCLAFRSPALLTGYAGANGLEDPKTDGWWVSGDLGTVDAHEITVTGRADDVIKIGGESVSLSALQGRLDALLPGSGVSDAALAAVPDERLGAVLVLVATGTRQEAEALQRRWNDTVLPFERAREIVMVPAILRTPLGKRDTAAIRRSLLS